MKKHIENFIDVLFYAAILYMIYLVGNQQKQINYLADVLYKTHQVIKGDEEANIHIWRTQYKKDSMFCATIDTLYKLNHKK